MRHQMLLQQLSRCSAQFGRQLPRRDRKSGLHQASHHAGNWAYGYWSFVKSPRTMMTSTVLARADSLIMLAWRLCSKRLRWLFMSLRLVKPSKAPVCFSYTKSSWICISSVSMMTYFCQSSTWATYATIISCLSASSEKQTCASYGANSPGLHLEKWGGKIILR